MYILVFFTGVFLHGSYLNTHGISLDVGFVPVVRREIGTILVWRYHHLVPFGDTKRSGGYQTGIRYGLRV